jgi:serine/threonine-protein kinase
MDDARILDRYRLIERLASGGTAELWRAHDEQLDRPVAVKRLHPHLLPDEASRRRLAAEARAAAGLSHPAIVAIYDVDAEGETPALVMELVEGESLATRIARDGPLSAVEAARLVADLADGLYHAHQQGVIHRDVKPANVLLGRDGRVRLVDFGIAHSLADAAQRLTQTGTVIGTLPAMAPEQLAAGPITPRTDLYGLGVVLYEAITGTLPYPTSTPLVLAEAQRRGPQPIEGIDPQLAAIIKSCLAYDPADRPLHAGALAAALRDWASSDAPTVPTPVVPAPLAPASSSAAGGVPPATIAPVPATGSGAVDTTSHRGRRPGWVLIGLAAAAAVLLVAWLGLGAPLPIGDAVADATPTQTPTATVGATPVAEWAIELAAEIEEACGGDATASAEELGAMSEEEAEDYADALIEACEEATDGDGGRGGGNGSGGNNGNGNGGNNGNRGNNGNGG